MCDLGWSVFLRGQKSGGVVIIWSGDPLELLTDVEHVIIRGREVPLMSRETLLRDRYMNLDENVRTYPRP